MKTFLTTMKGKIIAGVSTLGVVGAVIATILILNSGYRTIAVQALNGATRIINGSKTSEAYVGLHLKSGDDVTVSNDSDLTLAMDQDKYMFAEPNTHFWIEAKGKIGDTRTVVKMDKGSNLFRIDNKLVETEEFRVETPNATMSVRGTVFRVSCYEDENGDIYTLVEVFEGEVYVEAVMENNRDMRDNRILHAGESATIRSNDNISEFIKDRYTGDVVYEIHYREIPQRTAKILGIAIDDGRILSIGKELLFDYVGLIDHEFTGKGEVTEATCEKEGYYYEICIICGEKHGDKIIIPKKEHEIEEKETPAISCAEPGEKIKYCVECDEVIEREPIIIDHVYDEGKIIKEPTTQEEGIREYTCINCGDKKQEKIDKLPPSAAPIVVPPVEIIPTDGSITPSDGSNHTVTPADTGSSSEGSESSDEGSDEGSEEEEEEKDNSSKKKSCSHNYEVTSETEATCTAEGKKVQKCTKCGKTKTTTTAKKDHSYTQSTVAATCTEAGKIIKTCSVCGDKVESTGDAALGHSFTRLDPNEDATHSGTCSRCGETITEACSLSWASDSAEHWKRCSACSYESAHEAHSYDTPAAATGTPCSKCGRSKD